MTQVTKDQIPASCTTVESLAVWCAEVLQYLYPDKKAVEALNENGQPFDTRVAEGNKFYITASEVPEWRYLSRLSIALRKEHIVTGKLWENTKILGDEVVPTGMRS